MVGKRSAFVLGLIVLLLLGGGGYLAYQKIAADTLGNCSGGGLVADMDDPTDRYQFVNYTKQPALTSLWYEAPSLEPVSIYADVVSDVPRPDQLPPGMEVPLNPAPELYARNDPASQTYIPLKADEPTTVKPRQNGSGHCGFWIFLKNVDRPGLYTVRVGRQANLSPKQATDSAFIIENSVGVMFYYIALNPVDGGVRIPGVPKVDSAAIKKAASPVSVAPWTSVNFEVAFYGMTPTNFPVFWAYLRNPHFVRAPNFLDISNPVNLGVFVLSAPKARVSWSGNPDKISLPSHYIGYFKNRTSKGFRLPFNGGRDGGTDLDDFFTGTMEVRTTGLAEQSPPGGKVTLQEWADHPNWYDVVGGDLTVKPQRFTVTFTDYLCSPDILIYVQMTEIYARSADDIYIPSPVPPSATLSIDLLPPRDPVFIGGATKPEIPATVTVANRSASSLYLALSDVSQRGEVIDRYGLEITGQLFTPQTWQNVIGSQSTKLKYYPDTPGLVSIEARGANKYTDPYDTSLIQTCQSAAVFTRFPTYKLKIFPQDEKTPNAPPKLSLGTDEGTKIAIGLDGWTNIKDAPDVRWVPLREAIDYSIDRSSKAYQKQLEAATVIKTPVKWRELYRAYFTGRAYTLAVLDREGVELPGFEWSTDNGATWHTTAESIPIDPTQWTENEAKQAIALRNLEGVSQSDLTIRLGIKDLDNVVQDFAAKVDQGIPLGLKAQRPAEGLPTDPVDPDDEDEIAKEKAKAETSATPSPATSDASRGKYRNWLARLFGKAKPAQAAESGPVHAITGTIYQNENFSIELSFKKKLYANVAYKVEVIYPKPDLITFVSEGFSGSDINIIKESADAKVSKRDGDGLITKTFTLSQKSTGQLTYEVQFRYTGQEKLDSQIFTAYLYAEGSDEPLGSSELRLSFSPPFFSQLAITKIYHPEDGKYQATDYNADKANDLELYPGDKVEFRAILRLPPNFKVEDAKNYTLVADLSQQAAGATPTRGQYDKDKNQYIWNLLDVATFEQSGSYAEVTYEMTLKDEIPANILSVGSRFYVYDGIEQIMVSYPSEKNEGEIVTKGTITGRRPLFVEHPLWVHGIGTLTSVIGRKIPYLTVTANTNALSFDEKKNDKGETEVTIRTPEERTQKSRTRTDKDGVFSFAMPRQAIKYEKVAFKAADGTKTEKYQMRLYVEYVNDEYGYDYRYVLDNNKKPIVVPTKLFDAPTKKRFNYDITFSARLLAADPDKFLELEIPYEDDSLIARINAGSEHMRALGLAKHYIEELMDDGKDGTHLLSEYQIHAMTNEGIKKFCGDAPACNTFGHMYLGEKHSVFRPSEYWVNRVIYHEWGHQLHFSLNPRADYFDNFYFYSDWLRKMSHALVPDRYFRGGDSDYERNFNANADKGGITISHSGLVNTMSHNSLIEGFANFMALILDRKFDNDDSSEWKLYYSWRTAADFMGDFSLPLPIYSGLVHSPVNVRDSEGHPPVVYVQDSEEDSVTSFMKFLVADETPANSSIVWWDPNRGVGSPNFKTKGTEDERLRTLLNLLRKTSRYSRLIELAAEEFFDYQSLKENKDSFRGYLQRTFGLFSDNDCDWLYDEGETLGEYSKCSFIAYFRPSLTAGQKSTTQALNPALSLVIGPRPWRDHFDLGVDDSTAPHVKTDKSGDVPQPGTDAYVRVTTNTSDNATVHIRYQYPTIYNQPDTTFDFTVANSALLPLSMPPPVQRSRAVIWVDGSSTPPIVIDSGDFWSALVADASSIVMASKTFVIDGGTPNLDLPPLLPLRSDEALKAGECRVKNRTIVECLDANGQSILASEFDSLNIADGVIDWVPGRKVVPSTSGDQSLPDLTAPPVPVPSVTEVTTVPEPNQLISAPSETTTAEPTSTPSETTSSVSPLPTSPSNIEAPAASPSETVSEAVSPSPTPSERSTEPAVSSELRPPADQVITIPKLVGGSAPTVTAGVVVVSDDPAHPAPVTAITPLEEVKEPIAAGTTIALETQGYVAGERVNVLIDNQLVAEQQVIPGENPTLTVTLPEDLPAGEHTVELERIDASRAGDTVRVASLRGSRVPLVILVILALASLVAYLVIIRPRLHRTVGIFILLSGLAATAVGLSDYELAYSANETRTYAMQPGETYIPPGYSWNAAVGVLDPKAPYRNPLYLWNYTTDLDRAWGTVGLVTLFQRLAGEWSDLHPGEILVFNDAGIRGGGSVPGHRGEGHAQGRAFDFWSVTRADGISRMLGDENYNHALTKDLTDLVNRLTNGNAIIYFNPPGGPEQAAQLGVTWDPNMNHVDHWHVEVPLHFQGPPVSRN